MSRDSLFWKSLSVLFLILAIAGWITAARRTPPTAEDAAPRTTDVAPAESAAQSAPEEVEAPAQSASEGVEAAAHRAAALTLERAFADTPAIGDPRIILDFEGWNRLQGGCEALAAHVSISPNCAFHVTPRYSHWEDDEYALVGPFLPGETYTVTLASGITNNIGHVLHQDLVRVIDIPHRPSSVRFADNGRHLAPGASSAIVRLAACNIPSVDIRARRVRDANLLFFLRSSYYGDEPSDENALDFTGGTTLTNSVETVAPLDETRSVDIDLRPFLPAGPDAYGAYWVEASYIDPRSSRTVSDQRLVVLSDIGLTVRQSESGDRAIAWATSLTTGKPLAGVRVSLYSKSNDPYASGTTAADGTVELRYTLDKGDIPFLATASLGNDLTFLPLSTGSYDVTPDEERPNNARTPGASSYEAFLFAPRGIVRPGESLPLKVLVRDLRGRLPDPFPVSLELDRPDGRTVLTRAVRLSDLGTAESEFSFDPAWPTGPYTVRAYLPGDSDHILGSLSVSVEEIVPPQIKVAFQDVPTAPANPGEEVRFHIASEYLFGAPAANLRVTASVQYQATPFKPKGWDGYLFGDETRPAKFSRTQVIKDDRLNEEGVTLASCTIPDDFTVPSAIRATLSATVRQAGGRAVTEFKSLPVSPVPFYIGLRPSIRGTILANQAASVDIALVAPDATPATNAPASLAYTLESVSRSWNWTRNNDGSWRYVIDTHTAPVTNGIVEVAAQAGVEVAAHRAATQEAQAGVEVAAHRAATLSLPTATIGEYRLRVYDPNGKSSTTYDFEVVSEDLPWAHTGTDNPMAVTLVPDRASYAPGDRVLLTVKAPFTGEGMLFLEGAGGEWRHRPVTLTNTASTVSFQVDDIDVPSIHATLVLLRPPVVEPAAHRADGTAVPIGAVRAIGSTLLSVVRPDRALDVALDVPTELLPQSPLSVSATVTTGGVPVPDAEVTFAAVDEGLCSLTRFQTPNPLAWANAPRWLPVEHYDLFGRLLPLYKAESAVETSHIGGDGDVTANYRTTPGIPNRRFRLVALWKGTVKTGPDGRASATFDVPEFTGKCRVMAVAIAPARYGSAEAFAAVRRPIDVIATFPRFLAPGDTFAATLELFNTTAATAPVTLSLMGPSQEAENTELCSTNLTLAAGASLSFALPLAAPETIGTAAYTVTATSPAGAAPPAPFYSETFPLPVRPPAPYSRTVLSGILKPGESATPDPAALTNYLPGAKLTVSASARPESHLTEALEYLVHYPYGCLEQTTSTVFPLLYLADFAATARPDLFRDSSCADFVEAGILRILANQRSGGGFSLWQNEGTVYPWGTLYATHFLLEARKAGHGVPAEALDTATDYVESLLSQTSPLSPVLRAYAAYVAILDGRASVARPWTDRLLEKRADLPRSARAYLAAALLASGRPRDAGLVLATEGIAPPADVTDHDLGDLLESPTRDLALVLSAQCDLDPEAPLARDAADALLARRSTLSRWYTTQENAMALLALGKYFRAAFGPSTNAPPSAELSLGPDHVMEMPELGSTNLPAAASATLRNTGSSPFFYTLAVTGVPREPPSKPDFSKLAVYRIFRDARTGEPISLADDNPVLTLAQGDTIAITIVLHPQVDGLDQLVVSDLLPAGLEIENPALATSADLPNWLREEKKNADWLRSRDIRDDRLVLFTGALDHTHYAHTYLARAVTPGEYVYPAIAAEAMYDPAIVGHSIPIRLVVTP